MNITKQDFARLASAAASIAESNHPVPVMRMARLEAAGGALTIGASDMQIWLSLSCPCEGDLPPLLVPADKLADCVSKLTADIIAVSVEGDALIIKAKGSKRKLATLPATGFPDMPAIEGAGIEFATGRFREGVAFTASSVSTDAARLYMNGIRIRRNEDGLISFVGTDAGMMAQFDYGASEADIGVTIAPAFAKSVSDMIDADTFALATDERRVSATWPGGSIVAMKVEGDFPDTDRIIPQAPPISASLQADDLLRASAGVQSLAEATAGKGVKKIAVAIGGNAVELSTRSAAGEASDTVEAATDGEVTFGVSSVYLDRVAKALAKSSVQIGASAPEAPLLFTSDELADRFAVVMPMKI